MLSLTIFPNDHGHWSQCRALWHRVHTGLGSTGKQNNENRLPHTRHVFLCSAVVYTHQCCVVDVVVSTYRAEVLKSSINVELNTTFIIYLIHLPVSKCSLSSVCRAAFGYWQLYKLKIYFIHPRTEIEYMYNWGVGRSFDFENCFVMKIAWIPSVFLCLTSCPHTKQTRRRNDRRKVHANRSHLHLVWMTRSVNMGTKTKMPSQLLVVVPCPVWARH